MKFFCIILLILAIDFINADIEELKLSLDEEHIVRDFVKPYVEAVGRTFNPGIKYFYYTRAEHNLSLENHYSYGAGPFLASRIRGHPKRRIAMNLFQEMLPLCRPPNETIELGDDGTMRRHPTPMVAFTAGLYSLYRNFRRPIQISELHLTISLMKTYPRSQFENVAEYEIKVESNAAVVPYLYAYEEAAIKSAGIAAELEAISRRAGDVRLRVYTDSDNFAPRPLTQPICTEILAEDYNRVRYNHVLDYLGEGEFDRMSASVVDWIRKNGHAFRDHRVELFVTNATLFQNMRRKFSLCFIISGAKRVSDAQIDVVEYIDQNAILKMLYPDLRALFL